MFCRKLITLLFLLCAQLSISCGPTDSWQLSSVQKQLSPNGRYIVVMRDNQARGVLQTVGADVLVELGPQRAVAVRLSPAGFEQLTHNPHIASIEIDPPRYLLAQRTPYGIPMVQADQVSDALASNRTVCVIDTGFDRSHEDLTSNVTGTDLAGTDGWWTDTVGHGTHVAGIIASVNNDLGVLGVLPSQTVALHIIKIFDDEGVFASNIILALNACQNAGARITSMSFGGEESNILEQNALQNAYTAGMLHVAAAGNDGSQLLSYPASYDSVISVAAIDANKQKADFSQFNSQVELAAPGVGVLSTVPMGSAVVAELTIGGDSYDAIAMEGSPKTSGTGPLVDCALGETTCPDASGKVCLISRGNINFSDKVNNCVAGGGTAAIIYNNEDGPLYGTLGDVSTSIPSVGITQADGEAIILRLSEDASVVVDGYNYAAWDGTSMATPYVSGVAALVWSHDTSLTNADIRTALQLTAEDLGTPGRDEDFGFGLVQAAAALAYLQPDQLVATPTFDPAPGNFNTAQRVTLSTTTAGAQIRYTLDGTDPTSVSTLYTAPIGLSTCTVTELRARAFLTDWQPSDIIAGTYTISGPDSDADGSDDCNDSCPNDANKTQAGDCGCGVADTDSDSDGTADCNDSCPNDANKTQAGDCGCAVADTDSDSDGTADCNDSCPNDANKTQAGECGCAVADTDSDSDGTADCNDSCPNDANKVDPGTCGCGFPDTDTDSDGICDATDNCDNHANPDQADSDSDGQGDACDCGDGLIATGETCDDGNQQQGDGCSQNCQTEDGFVCENQPSQCRFDEISSSCGCQQGSYPGFNLLILFVALVWRRRLRRPC